MIWLFTLGKQSTPTDKLLKYYDLSSHSKANLLFLIYYYYLSIETTKH